MPPQPRGLMMSHHPAIHAHETEAFFAEALRLAPATKFVHGTLIAVVVVMVFGFCGFAQRLGLERPLVRLAGAWRWIGGLGSVIGVVGAFVFLTGRLSFDVHGFGMFVLAQSVWNLAVGVKLALRE